LLPVRAEKQNLKFHIFAGLRFPDSGYYELRRVTQKAVESQLRP
jgi:hypothetical protein